MRYMFAPVAWMETTLLLLGLAVHSGWEVHHMDVKSAFLNRDVLEQVYAHQSLGFAINKQDSKVLKLNKVLYRLHQVPRA